MESAEEGSENSSLGTKEGRSVFVCVLVRGSLKLRLLPILRKDEETLTVMARRELWRLRVQNKIGFGIRAAWEGTVTRRR